MLIKSYFKVVCFKFWFESVNVRKQTCVVGKRVPQGRPPHTRKNGARTAPGCAAEQSAVPGQLIEGIYIILLLFIIITIIIVFMH